MSQMRWTLPSVKQLSLKSIMDDWNDETGNEFDVEFPGLPAMSAPLLETFSIHCSHDVVDRAVDLILSSPLLTDLDFGFSQPETFAPAITAVKRIASGLAAGVWPLLTRLQLNVPFLGSEVQLSDCNLLEALCFKPRPLGSVRLTLWPPPAGSDLARFIALHQSMCLLVVKLAFALAFDYKQPEEHTIDNFPRACHNLLMELHLGVLSDTSFQGLSLPAIREFMLPRRTTISGIDSVLDAMPNLARLRLDYCHAEVTNWIPQRDHTNITDLYLHPRTNLAKPATFLSFLARFPALKYLVLTTGDELAEPSFPQQFLLALQTDTLKLPCLETLILYHAFDASVELLQGMILHLQSLVTLALPVKTPPQLITALRQWSEPLRVQGKIKLNRID